MDIFTISIQFFQIQTNPEKRISTIQLFRFVNLFISIFTEITQVGVSPVIKQHRKR